MGKGKIISVSVTPGCISCGTCAALCPTVFEIAGISKVKPGADLTRNAECIREAAEICPVGVIEVEEADPDASEGKRVADAGV